MALILDPDNSGTLSLQDYMDTISRFVKSDDPNSLFASAGHLQALANNRGFLVEYLNRQLASFETFQVGNGHGPQSLILGKAGGLAVRANVWLPASADPTLQDMEDTVFSYQVAHDHNFNFLTVGYSGPGYETVLYEYDNDQVDGYVGESVDIRPLGRTFLTPGKVIGFRASADIHTQLYPSALSVSINLLASAPEVLLKDQFYFDIEKASISSFVNTQVSARSTLLNLAKYLGDADTCQALDTLSKKHPTPRTRADAYAAFAGITPGEAERLWNRACADSSAYVRRRAVMELESRVDGGC